MSQENIKLQPVKKAVRKRSRKKNPKKEDQYFSDKTQEYILAYQLCENKREKELLYFTHIMPAFEKLVENLINVYKFAGLYDSFDDLKVDCVHFLFETLGKFKAEKGAKAFSYFNIVARNWLSVKSKKRSLAIKKIVSFDDVNSLSSSDQEMVEEYITVNEKEMTELEKNNKIESIISILHQIKSIVKTDNELKCINAVITVFSNIDEIDLLNKSAVLVYMRELSGLNSKQLTIAMSSIKKHYKKLKSSSEDIFDIL